MTTRADAAAETGERILDIAEQLFSTQAYDTVTLQAIAAAAGVGLQTVIRHGGSKDRIFDAASERAMERVRAERARVVGQDVRTILAAVVDHFEQHGDAILHFLAQRREAAHLDESTARRRAEHQEWVARAFAPLLDATPLGQQRRRLAQLLAITDVYTWYSLRREAGLSRDETMLALYELTAAVAPVERLEKES